MRYRTLALLIVAAGCSPKVDFVQTNTPIRKMAPRPVQTVEIYSTSLPERAYQEVGIINARAGNVPHDDSEVLSALRARAAQAGCDAVIINGRADEVVGSSSHGVESRATTSSVTGQTTLKTNVSSQSHVATLKGYWGACILWRPRPVARKPRAPKQSSLPRNPGLLSMTAAAHRPTLDAVKERVVGELLKEGISLERLDTSVSFTNTEDEDSLTVALIDRSRDRLITFKKLTGLPEDEDAMVAHLVVVVRALVESLNATSS